MTGSDRPAGVKRYVYILLFVVALATPFVLRLAITRGGESGATSRDAGRLVVITPHALDIRREFGRAFGEWHARKYGRPVVIDYRIPGGTNDIRRQLEATYRGFQRAGREPVADVHVAWGGGDYFFYADLQPPGLEILQPMDLDPALLAEVYPQPTLAGVRLYDVRKPGPDGRAAGPKWVGVCLSSFGIVYNADLYASLGLEAPAGWHDLAHEKLSGMLALADPTHSGSAAVAYLMVVQRRMADAEAEVLAREPRLKELSAADREKSAVYQSALAGGWKRGMGELLLIAANARYFTDMAPQVPHDVGNGEAAAGVAIDFYGRVYEEIVGSRRCSFVAPAAATAITPDPVAILAGVKGEPLELARHFVEFLLSREGQLLWAKRPGKPGGPAVRALRRPPVRQDVYADQSGWADKTNPFAEAGGFNQRAEWTTLLTDLRMVWAAAWVDGREALRQAYADVLRVNEGARRAALLGDLARVPIEMADVAALRDERKRREGSDPATLETWKAQRRMQIAATFRAHYEAVGAKARGGAR
jgi:iron(III) transport system substrate-binding protein